jgi:LPS-assembly protein
VFERSTDWFGIASLQTLEPRLFYLYTPYRNQDDLPVFDTAEIDFNFGSLFRENRFTGQDRIADANQLTLALTSRTLADNSGAELLRASIGQIYYFRDLRVQLPGQPEITNNSSTLASEVAARLSQSWSARGSVFWNPHDGGVMQKGAAELHYQTAGNRIFNLGYRYNRGEEDVTTDTRISDTDVSLRWPVGSHVHFIGRWKYSLFYDTTMDSFAGFEYDSCCWALRALARHYVSDVEQGSNTSFMVQLELKGLAAVGNQIDSFLEEGILGYRAE